MNRLIDGQAGFLLSPICKILRKGFAGGYHFKRVKVSGDERFHDKADKNSFSHPHDALQYMLSGGGEGAAIVRPFASADKMFQVESEDRLDAENQLRQNQPPGRWTSKELNTT